MKITNSQAERLANAEKQYKHRTEEKLTLKTYFNSFDPDIFTPDEWDYVKEVLQKEKTQKMFDWKLSELEKRENWKLTKEFIYSDFGEIVGIAENKNKLISLYPESFSYIRNLNLNPENLKNFVYHVDWYLRGHEKKPIQELYTEYFKR